MTPVGTTLVTGRGERRVVVQTWDAHAFLLARRMEDDTPGFVSSTAGRCADLGEPDAVEEARRTFERKRLRTPRPRGEYRGR